MAFIVNGQTGTRRKKDAREKLAKISFIAICLVGIAIIFAFLVFDQTPKSTTGKLVINEVMASNRYTLTNETLGTPDWIELYNGSHEAIDLTGYSLTNNAKDFRKFTFPNIVLGAGEYLVVYACDVSDKANDDAMVTGFNISKSGELLFLSDAYAGLVQQLEVPELYSDVSYARSASGVYGFTFSATPGSANNSTTISSSLSQLLNTSSGTLVLNEVNPYPSDGLAWAEIYNPMDEAVQLNDYYISDHPDDPLRVNLPDYILKSKGYALIYFSSHADSFGNDQLIVEFGIGREDTTLQLTSTDREVQSALTWSMNLPNDISVVRGDNACTIAVPTPLSENPVEIWGFQEPSTMDSSDPVVISEVMPSNKGLFPDRNGETPEWVELHNQTNSSISLKGYYLSDDPESPAKFALTDQMIDANGYLVVWLSGDVNSEGDLYAGFNLAVGETLTLTDLSTMRQDKCMIDGKCPENASFSVSGDNIYHYYGTPTPGYTNAKPYTIPNQIGWFDSDGVCISEVNAAGDGTRGDWIELFNGSSNEVTLDGWSITDDYSEPHKVSLTGISIPAEGYAVIDISAGDYGDSFSISSAGETLFLFNEKGCPDDIFQTGVLTIGVTSGRVVTDHTISRVFFSNPTFGENNAAITYSGYAAVPKISNTELYHDAPFALNISASSTDAVIRYTTDGSCPDEDSSVYLGPIEISKNCVIRATSFEEGLLPSKCVSITYLFSEPHTIPVVCIVADPDELHLVLKTQKREDKPECSCDLAYFDESGEFCVSFRAGIRAKGRSMLKYTQKSFSIKLWGRYGQSSVSYRFFEDSDVITYSAFSLRNGGQDRGGARLRDSYFSRLAEDLKINNFKTRIVALYLNGKFYGIYDLNEEQDESYLASHYGVDSNAVDIINRNDEVKEGSADEFVRVRQFAIEEDLSNDDVYAQFCEWVDVAYFTDYLVFRSYVADTDMINQAYWRSQDYSVKWQPIMFDLDYGLYGNIYQQSYEKDVLGKYFSENGIPSANKSKTYFEIYIGLKKNAGWRRQFVARYIELMNTTLSPEHMLAVLDEMDDDYLTEMPRQVEEIHFPASIRNTPLGLEQLRDAIEKRPTYALKYLKINFPNEADYIDELVKAYK